VTVAGQIDSGLRNQLELARQIQLRLLPDWRCCLSGWGGGFSYESAGVVSGDYVDLTTAGADSSILRWAMCRVREGGGDADVAFACHAAEVAAFAQDD
jgi:hypothetical protein